MSANLPAATAACQRCKLAKRRCDHGHPKCSGCTKAGDACIIVDPVTSKRYSRQYIGDLEAEEKALLARLEVGKSPSRQQTAEPSLQQIDGRASRGQNVSESPATASEFVGESSGLNHLRSIFSSGDWTAHKNTMLLEASQRLPMPELNMSANEAPTFEEASALINNYFSRFHIHHSFLVRDDVFATFDRVYTSDTTASLHQDRFRLFMIFAISGVTRYRAGLSKAHPYGYYLAAIRSIEHVPLIGSADAVQNLLLVARFGMYYHVGISLWDISRSCMRQCVELGYHIESAKLLSPFDEQTRRRIFWECYILDRYSSGTLGRPFAIVDEDISIGLPAAANDETVRSAQQLSAIELPSPQLPTELSVFVFCIKLRRITSRIRTDFYSAKRARAESGYSTPRHVAAAGDAQMKVNRYLDELDAWRLEAPIFANPGSLYQRPEWYDFLLATDKLALLRAAMHASPRWPNNRPPPRLLRLNLESATRAIELYADMQRKHFITWTRNYFQTIFTAGISIIHCLSFGHTEKKWHVADSDRFWPALESCSNILTIFKREMPDCSIFTIIFREMLNQLAQKRPRTMTNTSPSQHILNVANDPCHSSFTGDAMDSSHWASPGYGLAVNGLGQVGPFAFSEPDAFLSGDILQSLEAGLGQYACGYPGDDPFNIDYFEMGF